MKPTLLLKLMRFWPPFLGAGINVKEYREDFSYILVQMKSHFWNKNYVGTHFGGSLYTMTDPFYMLMLIKILGSDYVVWDKSARIRYKKPARGTVFARFELTPERISYIKRLADDTKAEPEFHIEVTDSTGAVVADIYKTLHITRKPR
ncbi:DUF4442 domain-containing protein [Legionella nagasakiensis]|uniref:DUF4442 domain-containing protein n=1 Tax=Legionella nagasakiensis TaxID=535290 RepID=UPI0010564E8F|nr:DUF4442 domain-containing protein [Legionella nagasakiensis]